MRNYRLFFLSCSVFIAAATPLTHSVQPHNYQAFWVWGGIKTAQIPPTAQRLYILQGSIRPDKQQGYFQRQGILVKPLNTPVFLVYRLEILAWDAVIWQSILNQIHYWEAQSPAVLGIQLDFDAQTKQLDKYEQFLRQVRITLPQQYQLSITGLLDWSQNASPTVLQILADTVDEVIFQTYQGKHTIPHYKAYLHSLAELRVPFKVGIVARGVWDRKDEQWLEQLSHYKGIVVFLLP
ncbi:DUF3142 domain-containing protein [Beggiatoa leptomitoformis]|uniref:DUF3142 domain-containing protein n=1 Tax=Beggiatoa leptomitoformis TaxID=288004 RepID=A0A2N9YHI2_9GAMM|nr:DUF3142 domain-containing protein [Beggiatoa leptomitoformis]ALG67804.1 DUF3142 domain-containing protein [Beggiatoa leptomitoformis]AUI69944.1 DUF3142 domain-containing protein [Beggiatoa leptomitoformis]